MWRAGASQVPFLWTSRDDLALARPHEGQPGRLWLSPSTSAPLLERNSVCTLKVGPPWNFTLHITMYPASTLAAGSPSKQNEGVLQNGNTIQLGLHRAAFISRPKTRSLL